MALRWFQEADKGPAQGTLAAAALTHHAKGLTLHDVEAYVVHRLYGPGLLILSLKIYLYMVGLNQHFPIALVFIYTFVYVSVRILCHTLSLLPRSLVFKQPAADLPLL